MLLETTYKENWEVPGGVIETGESPLKCAIRELHEELGVLLSPGRLLVTQHFQKADGVESISFLFDGGELNKAWLEKHAAVPNSEIKAAHWVPLHKVAKHCTPFVTERVLQGYEAAVNGQPVYLEGTEEFHAVGAEVAHTPPPISASV